MEESSAEQRRVEEMLAALCTEVMRVVQANVEEEARGKKAQEQLLARLRACLFAQAAGGAAPGVRPAEASSPPSNPDIIRLNVGGCTQFVAHRSTFTLLPSSRLGQVFREGWDALLPRDASGRIFLDLDPVQFRALVDWLADIRKLAPEDPLPPHPVESLGEQQRWGFRVLCRHFGLPPPETPLPATYGELLVADRTSAELVLGCGGSKVLTSTTLEVLRRFLGDAGDECWPLLYQASRDGTTAQAFHAACDGKAPTITVARSSGGHIFGAYVDAPWDGTNRYKSSSAAFLFRLHGPGVAAPSKHPAVRPEQAVYCVREYGAAFGGGHDLCIYLDGATTMAHFRLGTGYQRVCAESGLTLDGLAEAQTVVVAEWEVFEVASTNTTSAVMANMAKQALVLPELQPNQADVCKRSMDLWMALGDWNRSLALKDAKTKLDQEQVEDQEQFLRHLAGHATTGLAQEDIVTLNVRGVMMATFRATLGQHPESLLGVMFGERWHVQEEEVVDGGVFVDQDPELLALVLQFLRLQSMGLSQTDMGCPRVHAHKAGTFERLLQYLGMDRHLPEAEVIAAEQRLSWTAQAAALPARGPPIPPAVAATSQFLYRTDMQCRTGEAPL